MKNFINLLCFQSNWFICIYAAAKGNPNIGPAIILLWTASHVWFNRHDFKIEIPLILTSAIVGFIFDASLVYVGFIEFKPDLQTDYLTTFWMLCLWVNLATTLRHCLAWLGNYPMYIPLLGGMGGVLAYYGGSKFGVISFPEGTVSYIAIIVSWAIALPLLYLLVNYLEQNRSVNNSAHQSNNEGELHV